MKLANPLRSPLSIFVAGVALIAGVRLARIPIAVMLPVSAAIATAGATLRQSQEPKTLNLDNPALEAELMMVHRQAQVLADGASHLRQDAHQVLTESAVADVLVTIQRTCDRAMELPAKIDQLAQRMQGNTAPLSIAEIQAQLADVETRRQSAEGEQTQLEKIADNLQRALQLAQEGQDARQVQVASLSALILEFLGVLQETQAKLRSSKPSTVSEELQASELRSLSEELGVFQENVDRLVK
jgi:chromosome segregation ATPase